MVRCKGWAILSWWEDLVPSMSDMSADPFWCDCRIGSYMIRYKCWMPFLECRHLVSYQEYSAWCWVSILWENGGTWSVTRNTQSGTEGRFDMTVGCSLTWSDVSAWPFWCDWAICPTWSDIRADAIIWENGGTWWVTRDPQSGNESPFDAMCLHMVECKCRASLTRWGWCKC